MRAKTICIYGESGNAKTTQAAFIARYVKEKTGKNTRLISSDGGGWAPVEDEGLIISKANPQGIVQAFNMTNRAMYLADWRKLSTGMWLKAVMQNGQVVRQWHHTTPQEWEKIGCYFIEGLTSVGSGFISHISKQDNSKDSLTKVMYAAPGYDEDGEHFGATDQGHVGMVQNELYNLTQQFGTLPVDYIIWTALVGTVTAKSARKIGLDIGDELSPTYGPQLAGNAKTAEAPQWFSDCLHLDSIMEQEISVVEGREVITERKRIFAFFQKHKSKETGASFLAKSSTGPSLNPKLRERFPGGFVELGFQEGLEVYLKEIDRLKEGRVK